VVPVESSMRFLKTNKLLD